MDEPVRLAVDLGTTHTVAVVRRAGQPARALVFDGTPLLPSGVFVDAGGTVHTGRDAQRLGAAAPERFEPYPKRRVDDGTVLLGEREVAVVDLLAAVLRRVAVEAGTAGVAAAGATLTCPSDWGRARRDVLRRAAERAGLGAVRLLDEPIAAATYASGVLGQQVPVGGALAVFDLGGGTFDVAVVARGPEGWRTVGGGGLDDLGGLDVDDALVGHLGHLLAGRDPQVWQRLSQPDGPAGRRDRHAFWTEVRAAKEMLSRAAMAPVAVPGCDEPLHLTREELDRVAGPLVARAVDETRRVLQRVALPGGALAGLLLVGGASRMPLVASRLHARLGIAATVPEQPELPVAYGALEHAAATARDSASPSPSPSVAGPAPFRAAVAGAPRGPAVPPARRARLRAGAAVLAVALTAGLASTAVASVRWLAGTGRAAPDGADRPASAASAAPGTLHPVYDVALPGGGAVAVTVAGDRVVSAAVTGAATTVTARPAAGGAASWSTTVRVEPAEVHLSVVTGLVVMDALRSATDDGDTVRAVLDAATGRLLWKRTWNGRRDVAYLGGAAIVEIDGLPGPAAVARVDLRTGAQRWRRDGSDDSSGVETGRVHPVLRWAATGDQGAAGLPASYPAMHDQFAAVGDRVVELDADAGRGHLLDTATGTARHSGALPLDVERWTVVGDLAVGALTDRPARGRDVLAAYRLPGFTRAWRLDLPAGVTVERVKPCAAGRVCVALDGLRNDQHRTIAVDTATGRQAWSVPVEWSDDENWYVADGVLLFGEATFGPVVDPRVLRADGTVLRTGERGSRAVAARDGRAAVQTATATAAGEVVWQVAVTDLRTGRTTAPAAVGADLPDRVALGGDLLAVVTADRRLRVLRATGLD